MWGEGPDDARQAAATPYLDRFYTGHWIFESFRKLYQAIASMQSSEPGVTKLLVLLIFEDSDPACAAAQESCPSISETPPEAI